MPTRDTTMLPGVNVEGAWPADGVCVCVGLLVRVTEIVGVLDAVVDGDGVVEGVGVCVAVCVLVFVPVAEGLAVTDGEPVGDGDEVGVPDAVAPDDSGADCEGVVDGVFDGDAVGDDVAVVVCVAVELGDDVAVAVADGSAGTSATPWYCVFAPAVTTGVPPFSHVNVAELNAYTEKGVVAYSVTPSPPIASCVMLASAALATYTVGVMLHDAPLFVARRTP